MTYIPVDVFIECMQTSGIKDRYEYYELHDRGIAPTDLMPKNPAIEYNDTYTKAYRKKSEVKARRRAYQQTPEGKARKKAYQHSPEQIAWRKAYDQKRRQKT